MAMTIMNDASAAMTLGELNKNISSLGRQLKKVSSGQRINSAGDDASGYSISERMRAQIRSLNQDTQNVQNGKSLLRVAEGGIQSIVEEIRHLKELALNAANDTNTDVDRATIQKEFDSRMANINDIASETNYNGKTLLDGTYKRERTPYETPIFGEPETHHLVPPGYDVVPGSGGTSVLIQQNQVPDLASKFLAASDTCKKTTSSVTSLFTNLRCETAFSYDRSGAIGFEDENGTLKQNRYAVEMNFQGLNDKDGNPLATIGGLDKQGFTILCTGCREYINIKFDASIDNAASTYSRNETEKKLEFVIGIKNIASNSIADMPKYIYEGIGHTTGRIERGGTPAKDTTLAVDGADTVYLDNGVFGAAHDLRIHKQTDSSGDDHYYLARNASSTLCLYDEGTYAGDVESDGGDLSPGKHVLGEEKDIMTRPVVGYELHEGELGNPLVIHHGTKANQALNVFINDMHTWSLKNEIPNAEDLEHLRHDSTVQAVLDEAKDMTLDDAKVTTQHDANVAIRVIEGALQYALDEVTYVGAYISRLDFTESNLVTSNENTIASESTIRDADMAKEMTDYTKANVLAQAAQSMLAQANQNRSAVLGLLQ